MRMSEEGEVYESGGIFLDELFGFIRSGNDIAFSQYLSMDRNSYQLVNVLKKFGAVSYTLLMSAAAFNRVSMMELLIDVYKADINATNEFGCTALMSACKGGVGAVKLLLSKPTIKLLAKDAAKNNCLRYGSNSEVFKMVVDAIIKKHKLRAFGRNKQNETIVLFLIKRKRISELRFLVERNCLDFHYTNPVTSDSPLHYACMYSTPAILSVLVNGPLESHINLPNADGCTPLILASQYGMTDNVLWLLHNCPTVNYSIINKDNKSAVSACCEKASGLKKKEYHKIVSAIVRYISEDIARGNKKSLILDESSEQLDGNSHTYTATTDISSSSPNMDCNTTIASVNSIGRELDNCDHVDVNEDEFEENNNDSQERHSSREKEDVSPHKKRRVEAEAVTHSTTHSTTHSESVSSNAEQPSSTDTSVTTSNIIPAFISLHQNVPGAVLIKQEATVSDHLDTLKSLSSSSVGLPLEMYILYSKYYMNILDKHIAGNFFSRNYELVEEYNSRKESALKALHENIPENIYNQLLLDTNMEYFEHNVYKTMLLECKRMKNNLSITPGDVTVSEILMMQRGKLMVMIEDYREFILHSLADTTSNMNGLCGVKIKETLRRSKLIDSFLQYIPHEESI